MSISKIVRYGLVTVLLISLLGCEQANSTFNPKLPDFVTIDSITLLDETGKDLSLNSSGLTEVKEDIKDAFVANSLATSSNYSGDWSGSVFEPTNNSIKPSQWNAIAKQINNGASEWVFISRHIDSTHIEITCIEAPISVSRISLINKNNSLSDDDIISIKNLINPIFVSSGLAKNEDLSTAWSNFDFVPSKDLISVPQWEKTITELNSVLPLALYPSIDDSDFNNVTIELETFENMTEVDWKGLTGSPVTVAPGMAGIPGITIDENYTVTQAISVTFSDSEISLEQKLTAVKNAILESLPEMPEGIEELTADDIEIELDAGSDYTEATVTITFNAQNGYSLEPIQEDSDSSLPPVIVPAKETLIEVEGSFKSIIVFKATYFDTYTLSSDTITGLDYTTSLTGTANIVFNYVYSDTIADKQAKTRTMLVSMFNQSGKLPTGVNKITSNDISVTSNYTTATARIDLESSEGLEFEGGTTTKTITITLSGRYKNTLYSLDGSTVSATSTKAGTRIEIDDTKTNLVIKESASFYGNFWEVTDYEGKLKAGVIDSLDGIAGVDSVTVGNIVLPSFGVNDSTRSATVPITIGLESGFEYPGGATSKSFTLSVSGQYVGKQSYYYIGGNYSASLQLGTSTRPFSSIQRAMTVAEQFATHGNSVTFYLDSSMTGANASLRLTNSSYKIATLTIKTPDDTYSPRELNGNNTHQLLHVNIPNDNINITLEKITLTRGKGTYGGAIEIQNGCNLTIKNNVSITSSNADYGGGVYFEDANTNGTSPNYFVFEGTISNNNAKYGGGVYLTNYLGDGQKHTIKGSISNNDATEEGGGIVITRYAHSSLSGTISNNEASIGGGVHIESADVSIVTGASISNNNSTKLNPSGGANEIGGGGIWVGGNGTEINMTGGIIFSNTSADLGGGILVTTNADFNMSGGEIRYNNATYGGGAYVSGGGRLDLSGNCIIRNNDYGGVREREGTLTGATSSRLYNNEGYNWKTDG